jgi:hypothetical protein
VKEKRSSPFAAKLQTSQTPLFPSFLRFLSTETKQAAATQLKQNQSPAVLPNSVNSFCKGEETTSEIVDMLDKELCPVELKTIEDLLTPFDSVGYSSLNS